MVRNCIDSNRNYMKDCMAHRIVNDVRFHRVDIVQHVRIFHVYETAHSHKACKFVWMSLFVTNFALHMKLAM